MREYPQTIEILTTAISQLRKAKYRLAKGEDGFVMIRALVGNAARLARGALRTFRKESK